MTHISLFEQPKEIKEEMLVDRIIMCKECKRKFIAKRRILGTTMNLAQRYLYLHTLHSHPEKIKISL